MTQAGAAGAEWRTARTRLHLDRTRIIGILNVTPDSFWDGGRHAGVAAAVAHAGRMLEDGADLLDVGGESTRPGAAPVAAAAEIARVVPVVQALAERWPALPISVDTTKATVAEAALAAGASVINDVSGLRLDGALGGVIAAAGAGVILMHSRGDVATMAGYELAEYGADPVETVCAELAESVARARAAGIPDAAIVLDPGLGFSKRTAHSVAVLAGLERVRALGYPVLVGPSRKRFVGELAGGLGPEARLEGTIAACVAATLAGARLVRVHDVGAVHRALAVADAVRAARS
ncbi:MAG TPA: dihydropteroate synthase [Longimicrobiales bacterium]|nr:dihydropteroate synthase [Longimicrobiales bacterium]